MKIYIDSEHKCHAVNNGDFVEIDTDFFDNKCEEFISGYSYKDGVIYPHTNYSEIEKKQIEYERAVASKVFEFGGFSQKRVQSDKLGFDWIEDYLGEKLLKQTYVEQEVKVGVIDNPIMYTDGCQLINNAFYVKPDGKLYVYMNGEWIEW